MPMIFSISLYASLAIFIIGLIYKISRWFSLKTSVQAKQVPSSRRVSSALRGIILTIFSGKILTLVKVFILDVLLQRKVLQEDFFRWITHLLIYGAFIFLLFMHALDGLTASSIFYN
jgi:hypothetical protein